jgi:hypothetical protein
MSNLPWPEGGVVPAAKQLFAKQAPTTLYHYTSTSSFLKIAADRHLWASNPIYLNDAQEVAHGLTLVSQMASELRQHHKPDTLWWKFYNRFINQRITSESVYVSSFSAIGDQLSQWRAYARGGGGVSIGFDAKELIDAVTAQQGTVGPVIYDHDAQEQLISDVLKGITYYAEIAINDIPPPDQEGYYSSVCHLGDRNVATVVPFLKHPAFAEECEWRVVFAEVGTKGILLRASGSLFVPYIKWSLPSGQDVATWPELVVGPSPHGQLKLQALQPLKSKWTTLLPVTFDDIKLSSAPYRDW